MWEKCHNQYWSKHMLYTKRPFISVLSFASLKTSLHRRKPYIWKWGSFARKWPAGGTHFHMNGFARTLLLTQRQLLNAINVVMIFDLPVLSKRYLLKLDSFHPRKQTWKQKWFSLSRYHSTKQNQEIVKVKEWIFLMGPDMGLISKVIPLKVIP